MNVEETIRAVQAALNIEVDGKAGTETWKAIYARIVPKPQQPATKPALSEPVSARSEKVIATLLPEVREYARALVHKAQANGILIHILSGLRSYEEQAALYAQGRTKPGKKVTNAPAGHSNHNFGIAFDVGVFEGTKYLGDSPKYKAVGALGMELGLDWGGNWKTIVDQPHFQLRPLWAAQMNEKTMLAELRARKDSGQPVYD